MPAQLILPIEPRANLKRTDFIVAPGNERALAFLESFPAWPAPAAALFGPPASGKSHLVSIWVERAGASILSAAALALTEPPSGPLVVEDIDAAPGSAQEARLFGLFERSAPLLLTARTPPIAWTATLPDLISRYRSMLAFELGEPDDALLSRLAAKLFADRQLVVPQAVIRRIIESLERSPAALRDFVARADAQALSEKRAINLGLIRELLSQT
jgi:chromosomal replication initiation ATPase DnaA